MKEKKKHVSNFLELSIEDIKTKKIQTCFVGIKIHRNSQNTTIFTQQG